MGMIPKSASWEAELWSSRSGCTWGWYTARFRTGCVVAGVDVSSNGYCLATTPCTLNTATNARIMHNPDTVANATKIIGRRSMTIPPNRLGYYCGLSNDDILFIVREGYSCNRYPPQFPDGHRTVKSGIPHLTFQHLDLGAHFTHPNFVPLEYTPGWMNPPRCEVVKSIYLSTRPVSRINSTTVSFPRFK